jgi:hypothetical protein
MEWSYQNQDHWPAINANCELRQTDYIFNTYKILFLIWSFSGGGNFQSPVDIHHPEFDKLLKPIHVSYSPFGGFVEITNRDFTVGIDLDHYDLFMRGGDLHNAYRAHSFSFHVGENGGSEHLINGQRYPLEMQIIHWNNVILIFRVRSMWNPTEIIIYCFCGSGHIF